MKRMLWPRSLYWVAFAVTVFGLFYAITGLTSSPGLVGKSNTQTGGALFAAIGVLVMVGGKAWMDAVVRSSTGVQCASCNRLIQATLPHCPNCGAPQRTTPQILRTLADVSNSSARAQPRSCGGCGAYAAPDVAFCRACGRSLVPANGTLVA